MSQLLLLSGASPNARTDFLSYAPILCVAAQQGHLDMVSRLIEFGADVQLTGDNGMNALSYAAQQGYISVIRLLTHNRARVSN